jgi:tetratricopeptide (TPR) repeat protein
MTLLVPFVAAVLVSQAPAQAAPADATAEAYYLFLQGRRLEEEGRIAEAVAALRRAATLLPRAAEIQAELGGLFAREGRAADAVSAAEAALGIDPSNREAHRVLGLVQAAVAADPTYASQAPTLRRQAIVHLEQVLAGNVIDLQSQLALSRLYAETGQHEKVIPVIKAFLSERPDYPEALLILAESSERLDRWEDAALAWTEVVQLGPRGRNYRPRYAVALVKLGDQYFDSKRYKDAAEAFDRALTTDRAAVDAADVTRKRDRARELAGR